MSNNHTHDDDDNVIAETENFFVWRTDDDPNDVAVYHIELGGITLHLMSDEWHELVTLIKTADK